MLSWFRGQSGLRSTADRALDAVAKHVYRRLRRVEAAEHAAHAAERLAAVPLLGEGVSVEGQLTLRGASCAAIGNNVHIGDRAYFRAEGGLTIGDNTHIGQNVTICTISREYEGEALPFEDRWRRRPVTIGRNVWIGANANVVPGTTIGDGAVIGMGATVSGSVPPLAIVTSPTHQVLKTRDAETYERLDAARQYGGVEGRPLDPAAVARFRPGIDEVEPFFVVSTGRSGSTTIARVLSQHPEVECLHEPRIHLIRLSTEWAHGMKSEDAVRAELDALYESTVCTAPVFGESDQNLSVLLEPLLERVPTARVVWLIRDGRDTVASSYRKGWYQSGSHPRRQIWDEYRLRGDACGDVSPGTWAAMSAFEKNCWYWSYVNRTIETQLSKLPADRWVRVRLEELDDQTDALYTFLGVEPVPAVVERHNAGTSAPRGVPAWDPTMAEAFERLCGEEMDRWYPNWRSEIDAAKNEIA